MAETHETPHAPQAGVRCDFCNAVVPSVRRIALDGQDERLRTPHKEQFACAACSEKKEQERLGMRRS
jgi:hypothetical protein